MDIKEKRGNTLPLHLLASFKAKNKELFKVAEKAVMIAKRDKTWDRNRCILPMQYMYDQVWKSPAAIKLLKKQKDTANVELAAILFSFERSKYSLHINQDIKECILAEDFNEEAEVPCEALKNLPYKAFYVDIDEPDKDLEVYGFFVRMGHEKVVPTDGVLYNLWIYPVMKDGFLENFIRIPLVKGMTFLEAIRKYVEDVGVTDFSDEDFRDMSEKCMPYIQLLLYICSINADTVKVARKPVPHEKPDVAQLHEKTTYWNVGERVGTALRRHRETERAHGGGTRHSGATVRAHIRRGHFHHYWCGSEAKGTRRLILKWTAPTFINCKEETLDFENNLPNVIRDVHD